MSSAHQTSDRSSLREGLRILEVNGLIEVRSGKGIFVSGPADTGHTIRVKFLADKWGYLNAARHLTWKSALHKAR